MLRKAAVPKRICDRRRVQNAFTFGVVDSPAANAVVPMLSNIVPANINAPIFFLLIIFLYLVSFLKSSASQQSNY